MTLDGFIKGSPGYLAPEQIDPNRGPKDFKSDIYSLGGILYFLLSFKTPFSHKDINESLKMTLSGEIKELNKISNPQFKIPNSLAAVAMKALSTKKQDRYSNIDELRSDIIKWREGFATEAENASIVQLLKLLIKRNKI